ncbi:MAG: hypothetical protein ACRELX_17160, partial [Longimicrobiales bacterium]
MIRSRATRFAAAFIIVAAALDAGYGVAPAAAQSPAALARAAANAARKQAPIDALVTPEALRALQRLADSANAANAGDRGDRATKPTPEPRTSNAPVRRNAAAPALKNDRADQQLAPRTLTEIVVRENDGRRELRLLTSTPVRTRLSEPFRAPDRTRLFLTLDSATITDNARGDAADITEGDAVAAVIPAARDAD